MSKVHLNKDGRAKCGASPWGSGYIALSNDQKKVTCKRCLNKVVRKAQSVEVKEDMLGKIFHSSFGYNMTINEYAKVIKQSPKSILLQMCVVNVENDYGRGDGKASTDGHLKKDGRQFRLYKKVKEFTDYKTGEKKSYTYWAGGRDCDSWSEWDGQENYHNTWD